MEALLQSLVTAARDALSAEDQLIRRLMEANSAIYSEERNFILRDGFHDERYYQRLVARAILTWPFKVILEKNRHDLVLVHGQTPDDWFLVVEMKRWMGKNGDSELQKIIADIDTLKHTPANHRIMLIFSANPASETKSSVGYLSNRVSQFLEHPLREGENFEIASFLTTADFCITADSSEFWIGGIEVPPHTP